MDLREKLELARKDEDRRIRTNAFFDLISGFVTILNSDLLYMGDGDFSDRWIRCDSNEFCKETFCIGGSGHWECRLACDKKESGCKLAIAYCSDYVEPSKRHWACFHGERRVTRETVKDLYDSDIVEALTRLVSMASFLKKRFPKTTRSIAYFLKEVKRND
jgi:hypothetical protein